MWQNLGDVLDAASERDAEILAPKPYGAKDTALCPGCQQEFPTQDMHSHYELTHGSGVIPAQCPDCIFETNARGGMNRHRGRHKKEKR